MRAHIHMLRSKPHHVKKQAALTLAGIGAGAIGALWLVGSVASGSFAIQERSFADATEGLVPSQNAGSQSPLSGLAGAAAALSGREDPARIEIVEVKKAATAQKAPEPTTIPF